MNDFKINDVFRWSFTEEEYARRRKNSSDPYWCCSNIGIIRKDEFGYYLEDTYWGSCSNKSYNLEDFDGKINLAFLGNLDDFEVCRKTDQAMYADVDILDLTHANGGGVYLRKGAVKSKDKMIAVIKRNAYKLKQDVEYAQRSLQWELDRLKNIDELNYASALDKVSMKDVHYEDETIDEWLDVTYEIL